MLIIEAGYSTSCRKGVQDGLKFVFVVGQIGSPFCFLKELFNFYRKEKF